MLEQGTYALHIE